MSESKEEILARMRARRKEAQRPKRIREAIIILVILVLGYLLIKEYYESQLVEPAIDQMSDFLEQATE